MRLKFDFREIARFSQGIREWVGRSAYWATGKNIRTIPLSLKP